MHSRQVPLYFSRNQDFEDLDAKRPPLGLFHQAQSTYNLRNRSKGARGLNEDKISLNSEGEWGQQDSTSMGQSTQFVNPMSGTASSYSGDNQRRRRGQRQTFNSQMKNRPGKTLVPETTVVPCIEIEPECSYVQQPTIPVRTILAEVFKVALTSAISNVFVYLQDVTNLAFAGHFFSDKVVAAIGTGNMIQILFVTSVSQGINATIETLASQATGAGDFHACEKYLTQSRVLVCAVFVVQVFALSYSKEFLLLIGQDSEVSSLTQVYVLAYMPGLLLFNLCDLEKRFLNSVGQNLLPMLAYSSSVVFHPLWVYIFAVKLNYQIQGIAIAGVLTNLQIYLVLGYLARQNSEISQVVRVWRPGRQIFDASFITFVKTAAMSVILMSIDFVINEIMIAASGFITVTEQATMVIQMNLCILIYLFGMGFQTSACLLIGKKVGRLDIKGAQSYYKTIQACGIVYSAIMAGLIWVFYKTVVRAMTSIDDIVSSAMLTRNYFLVMVFFYTLKNVPRGVAKALGVFKPMIKFYVLIYLIFFPGLITLFFNLESINKYRFEGFSSVRLIEKSWKSLDGLQVARTLAEILILVKMTQANLQAFSDLGRKAKQSLVI